MPAATGCGLFLCLAFRYNEAMDITSIYILCVSAIIPLAFVLILPKLLRHYGLKNEKNYRWLLYAAAVLFCVSWYLPSPLIHEQDMSSTTHFVGGGMFTGFLWLYLKFSFGWRSKWWIEALSLFALVSALGNINELVELFMVETGLSHILLNDTNWDILANTLGSRVVYFGYIVYDSRHR